ncbi:MAG: hypothetical protein L6W00_08760 [Lentisphaeria bacterium]|nr:MAG: hypothetical protein L6W00_08760 [Lentisphaeria bacterium]
MLKKMIELLSLCGADEVRLSWLWPQINPAPRTMEFSADRLAGQSV